MNENREPPSEAMKGVVPLFSRQHPAHPAIKHFLASLLLVGAACCVGFTRYSDQTAQRFWPFIVCLIAILSMAAVCWFLVGVSALGLGDRRMDR